MKKRLWRLISVLLIFTIGFAGPLGNIAFALADPLDTFDFDLGTNPYIEFKNTSGSSIDVNPTGKINFTIQGTSLDEAILDSTNSGDNSLIEPFAVQLINADTSQVVDVLEAKGDLFNNTIQDVLSLAFMLNGTPLDNDTNYRIEFLTPTIKTLLNRVGQSIYIGSGDPSSNVSFKLMQADDTLVSENTSVFENSALTGTEIAGTKEFDGSNTLEISGPTVTMDLGDLSDYDNVEKVELRFEGDQALSSESLSTILASLNEGSDLSGSFSVLNGSGPYVYGVTVYLSGPATGTSNSLVLEFDETDMAMLEPVFSDYIVDQKATGNVYVLGYNSGDEVVGYNLFTNIDDSVPYVDGSFVFDGAQPNFTGYYETPPTLMAMSTGHTADNLLISGETSFDNGSGTQTIPFTLEMYHTGSGNYKVDGLGFEDYTDKLFEQTGSINMMPVNIFEANTITLTGENVFQESFTRTFTWEPDADTILEYFSDDHGSRVHLKTYQIGPNFNDIEIDMPQYNGNTSDLAMDLYYNTSTTSGGAIIAPYSLFEASDYEMFYEPGPGSEMRTLGKFTEDETYTTPYLGFDGIDEEGGYFTAELRFNNPDISLGDVKYLIPVQQEENMIKFDEEQPDPHVEYFDGYGDGAFKFLVKFGWDDDSMIEEKVFLDQFTSNLEKYISLDHKDKDVSGIGITSIEGYRDSFDTMASETDPYSFALVGIDTLPPRFTQMVFEGAAYVEGTGDIDLDYDDETGELVVYGDNAGQGTIEFHVVKDGVSSKIKKTFEVASASSSTKDYFFQLGQDSFVSPEEILAGSTFFIGFEDAYGNPLVETVKSELIVETPIDSYLVDETGNYLLNAELGLIPTTEIPEPVSGSAIVWEEIVHLQSNDDGKVFGSVYPGTYLAFNLELKDDQGKREEYPVDMELSIPVSGQKEPYTNDIILPTHNVYGQSLRASNTSYRETIVFIDADYLTALQNAMTDHENWELFDVLETFYIKKVETDLDGSFSTYLRPQKNSSEITYALIGKFEGESVIGPKSVAGSAVSEASPFTFTVSSVSTSGIEAIEFPPPTLTGVLENWESTPEALGNVFIELKGDNGFHYATITGEDGAFNLAVNEPGTYNLSVARTDWDMDGEGLLFVDKAGFDTVTLTQNDIDNIEAGSQNPVDMGTVTLPSPNFEIQFQVDGQDVGQGEYSSIMIEQVVTEGEEPPEFHVPTQTGGFTLYLPSADYEITEFNYGELWLEPETPLSFNIPSTTSPYYIALDDYYNGVITVENEDGAPLAGYRVETQNLYNNWWRGATTNAQGKAYFNFEVPDDGSDATIEVRSYVFKDKWYDLWDQDSQSYESFTVNKNHGGTNAKASYTITVRAPNFTGSVFTDQAKTNQIFDGHLDVRKEASTAGDYDQWYWIYIDQSGDFSFVLPEEGTYMIESAGAHTSTDPDQQWFEIGKAIEVKLINSKLVVVEPGTTTPISMPIELGPQPANFFGDLYKTGTTPYLSSVDPEEYYVAMLLRETGVDPVAFEFEPWKYERRVEVAQDGSFSSKLDSSKSWEVYAVETSRGWFEYSTPVTVTVSESVANTITAPVPNFNGQIAGFENAEILNLRHGRVELENIDGTQWIGADIDGTGFFGKQLEDGSVWFIREYFYEQEDPSKPDTDPTKWSHTHVRLDKKITVGTNSDGITLAPNFKIDLSASSDLISAPTEDYENFFNANIRPVLTLSDFTAKYPNDSTKAAQEYERYQMNPWEFGTWVEGKYNDQTGHIEFFTFLETGSYELMDVNGQNVFLEINEPFTLDGASSSGVRYNDTAGSYTMNVAFTTNVEGTITENGQPVDRAWVNFMRTDLDWDDHSAMRWFGTSTNAQGQFALNLPSDEVDDASTSDFDSDDAYADYKLEGYHTEGQWAGNVWQPGQWTPVGFKFKINDAGELLDSSGQALAEITVAPNVTGEVYKIFKSHDKASDFFGTPSAGDYAKIKQAWLTIWPYDKSDPDYEIPWEDWEESIWTETNPETGNFTIMLDPGDYIVTEASMNNFWFRPDTVFTVDANGDLVDESDDAVENGKLVIQPEEPNFKGTAYRDSAKTTPLKWGWIMLRPAEASQEDWESTVWINTDSSGDFEMKLEDGNWKVIEMGNYDFWKRVNIPFTVAGSEVTSSVAGFMTNGLASVYPPDPNLKGLVKNKSGNQVFTNAWLTIKPADASDYDWENTLWTEYRLRDDDTYRFEMNIEPGQYKITEVGAYDFFYHTDIRFTVSESGAVTSSALENGLLVVEPPQPNLTGTVYGDTDNDGNDDDPVANGWLGIARYENGKQVTMEGQAISSSAYKDEWSNMYWQHTRWTETNGSGGYEMNLDTGTYQIIGVGGQGVWYQPRLEFEIEDGQTTILDISEPGPNVTVTVTGVPTAMQSANYAWLDVFREVDGDRLFEPVEFVEKDGNGNFVFKSNLASGSYTIGFFGTDLGGLEIDDASMTVSGTTNKTVNVGQETGKQVVEGQILKDTSALGQKAWIKIEGTVDGNTVTKKTQTNVNGEFKFKLPDNTDWTVVEISLIEGYLLLPESPDYEFNSGTSASPSAAWNLDIGSLLQ